MILNRLIHRKVVDDRVNYKRVFDIILVEVEKCNFTELENQFKITMGFFDGKLKEEI
ncbi:hypothetical protein [Metaclostridioides mangenotii]|uniref:hypothetical protein n=1 Tax=Metaclostridioides mangenotii TaxID=1540 RepID=UPI0004B1C836|nr:hypothetical protein [Clostridioides mangenotii]